MLKDFLVASGAHPFCTSQRLGRSIPAGAWRYRVRRPIFTRSCQSRLPPHGR